MKRWCVKRLTRYKQKVLLAAMLEGKSLPSIMAAKANHTTLLKNQSAMKYLPWTRFLSNFGCKIILDISKIPTHCLKESRDLLVQVVYLSNSCSKYVTERWTCWLKVCETCRFQTILPVSIKVLALFKTLFCCFCSSVQNPLSFYRSKIIEAMTSG